MKRLYLLRHAKSSWDDPTLADEDRPLAPRGRRAAKVIAKHLGRKGIAPELVLCSPSKRTRQTLTRIAPGLGKNADVQIDPELYAAAAPVLLELLHEVPDEVESVMLIGHNPGIQDLALSLASAGSESTRVRSKFPTAALATLELNGSWRELSPGSAELVSVVKPKELSRGAAGRDMSGYAYLAGVAGAALGIVAGIAQWAFGNEIPEWTGNKLHPVQLGIVTIALSLIALAAVVFAHRNPTIPPRVRVALAVAILLAAVVCFTTVGRLWYAPGPLLIITAGFLLAGSSRAPGRAVQ